MQPKRLRTQPSQKDGGSGDRDSLHRKGVAWGSPARVCRCCSARAGQRRVAKCCSPLKDDEDELAGVEETAVARTSDGGGSVALWRRTGAQHQRAPRV
jgi:hypothetical protein